MGKAQHAHPADALELRRSPDDLAQERNERHAHPDRLRRVNQREHVPDVRIARRDHEPIDPLRVDDPREVRRLREIRERRLLRLRAIALDRSDHTGVVSSGAQRPRKSLRCARLPHHQAALWRQQAPSESASDYPQAERRGKEAEQHGHHVGAAQPACHRGMTRHPHAERVKGRELEQRRRVVEARLTQPHLVLVVKAQDPREQQHRGEQRKRLGSEQSRARIQAVDHD